MLQSVTMMMQCPPPPLSRATTHKNEYLRILLNFFQPCTCVIYDQKFDAFSCKMLFYVRYTKCYYKVFSDVTHQTERVDARRSVGHEADAADDRYFCRLLCPDSDLKILTYFKKNSFGFQQVKNSQNV